MQHGAWLPRRASHIARLPLKGRAPLLARRTSRGGALVRGEAHRAATLAARGGLRGGSQALCAAVDVHRPRRPLEAHARAALPLSNTPRLQKMQNPTGAACAAAPRFLQTLARAGSLRSASGRFLKTLGQNFSS